ncbi:pyruvate dehydrogenase E1 component alpha subunit [Scopulibacillus darangshiensis]|uniref:Pyruvate dehydrogenase E1 component subunit alpha n=1 Tax=Scopulibacillus darangshiensis TaxID=442528 RepID=A0A4R2P391_9BACL|nr:pyruvate dehydrogenase (acetyl-transferring) E1 component subunit alpha [Scopulibacillus darangshiensis]TCP29239.1 pyruvate dehydrogenase E1 component alpha subunit [Scopulibacillus darangshiensis]
MDVTFPIKQIVNGDGDLVDASYKDKLTKDFVTKVYQKMLFARMFDRKCVNLQRQGRIGTYVPFEGQEAAQVGSAMALSDDDWMFPTYRDHGATLTFGHSMRNVLMYWNGRYEGVLPPKGKNIFPPAVPIASQLLHATGAAWAEKKKGTDRVAMAYFGDGATSEGDFHEGLNFASVFQAPVIFFNQNNGFAISVPTARQMHSKTIAQKALAYDMDGVRIDGNDFFAVYFTALDAVEKARNGDGPTLIEAVTWRYGAHTTSDDPSKYRDQTENDVRRETSDPVTRIERFMKASGMWDEALDELEKKASEEIEAAVGEMEKAAPAELNHLFDYVFETSPWPIREQKDHYLKSRGVNA